MKRVVANALAFTLALTGCGESGSDGSSVPIVSGPAPTPTPSPTASPATYLYSTFDLTRDQVFAGQVASASTLERYTSDTAPFYSVEAQQSAIEPSRGRLELAYGADRSLAIRFGGETVRFSSADVAASAADGIAWRRVRTSTTRGDAASIGLLSGYKYVYYASQETDEDAREPNTAAAFRQTTRFMLIGDRSRDGDVPRVGVSTYSVYLITTPVGRNRGGGFTTVSGTLSVDHAQGTLTANLNAIQSSSVTGTPPQTAALVLSGVVNSSGIAGTLTSPTTGYTGTFAGDLFGPRAVEMGVVLTLGRLDGDQAAGILFGRRE